jgi:chitin disaccharide deacetylase
MEKELVITSDDLGMTLSVNRGIERARELGALTSTNFMVPCPWFEHAARRFRETDIDLGVHLTLTCEWSNYQWRPLTRASSLLDRAGLMYRTVADLMAQANAEDIRAECRAQVETALRRGLPIGYVDLHMCIPTLVREAGSAPRVANPAFELALMHIVDGVAREFGFPYPYALEAGHLAHFRSALSISGKGRDEIARYLGSLEPGIHHLSCHCAVDSDEQANLSDADDATFPWSLPYRAEDLRCITSPWFRALLTEHQVRLVRMPFGRQAAASSVPAR